MGSTSENSSGIQSLVEKVQKKRQSRDGWRTCASFGSVPDADCEDRARGRPRTKPHLCEAKYHAKPCRRVPGPTDRGGGRHSVDRKPNPPGERSEKTEAHRERVRPWRGWSPLMIAFCSRGARVSAGSCSRKTSYVPRGEDSEGAALTSRRWSWMPPPPRLPSAPSPGSRGRGSERP